MQIKASKYFRLTIFIFLISCNEITFQEESCILDPNITLETETERYCVLPEQSNHHELSFNIKLIGFDSEQSDKMQDALARLKLAVNSLKFEELVISHTYQDELTYVDNNGLYNEEIYEKIMLGAEVLQPDEDNEIDLIVNLYYSNNSTVGYTYENSKEIWINQKFFDLNSQAEIAGNILHEWTHKLGFKHDFYSTSSRNYSVPYAVGEMIEQIISEM